MAFPHELDFIIMIRPNFGAIILKVSVIQFALVAFATMVTLNVIFDILEVDEIFSAVKTLENGSGDVGVVKMLQLGIKAMANSFANFAVKSFVSHKYIIIE